MAQTTGSARAIYDYEARASDELTFKRHDIIEVLGQDEPMLDVVSSSWRVRFMSGDISEEHPEERFHAS